MRPLRRKSGFVGKSDDELRREVNFGQSLMKVKMGVLKKMQRRSAYPLKEFERDFRRTRMAQSLLQERWMRRENNNAVACLATASEGNNAPLSKRARILCAGRCMKRLRQNVVPGWTACCTRLICRRRFGTVPPDSPVPEFVLVKV